MIRFLIFTFLCINSLFAQTVIQKVFTDYNGFLESSVLDFDIKIVRDSHNVIGFQWKGNYFSTGVNDSLLLANKPELPFIKQPFTSFPSDSLAPPVNHNKFSNLIGVPTNYKGSLVSNYRNFITDGKKGLDVSTAVFNMRLEVPSMKFNNLTVSENSIGDGIPDIIVTQTGQPSINEDLFYFQDKNGVNIGVVYSVLFDQIGTLLKTDYKFYNLNYGHEDQDLIFASFIDGERDLRMLAFDWSDLGITKDELSAGFYKKIYSFSQKFSGESDIAFIAYNQNSLKFLRSISGKVEIDNGIRIPFQGIKLKLYLVDEEGEIAVNPIATVQTDEFGHYSFNNIESNVVGTKYSVVLDYLDYNPRFFVVENSDGTINSHLQTVIETRNSEGNDFVLGNFCILEPSKVQGGVITNTGISTKSSQRTEWPMNVMNGFLALDSKEKGFVITRTTSSQIPATSLIQGMLIYDTADRCIKLYDGTDWACIARDCNEDIFNPDKPNYP